MTRSQRVKNIVFGLLVILCGVVMVLNPEDGFIYIAVILGVSLTLSGIRYLVYYVTMARHMVGGKAFLFLGVLVLDIGMFSTSLIDEPRYFIVTYLLAFHALTGLINLLRGREEKKNRAPGWKLNVLHGTVTLLICAACVLYLRRPPVLVSLYCAGLVYSGLVRIDSALRRTAIVYIA